MGSKSNTSTLYTETGSIGVNSIGSSGDTVINVTDSGALEKVLTFGNDILSGVVTSINQAIGLSETAIDGMGQVTTTAIKANNEATDNALKAMLASQQASNDAQMAALQASLASASATTELAIKTGRDLTRDVVDLADRSQGRLVDTFGESIGLTKHIVDAALGYTGDSIAQIAKSYETSRDQDQEKSIKDYRYLLVAALAIIGIVAFKAVR